MSNTVLWIRHGESYSNLTKQFSHRILDPPLTEKGRLQARQTGEFVSRRAVQALYSSPLQRAAQTAEAIGQEVGLPVAVVEGFREVNVGELEMQPPSAENWALYLSIFRRWFDGEHEVAMPGGEDYVTLWARMQTGFRQVLEGRSGQTVAIVGHGGCISAVLQELCPDVDVRIVWDVPSHNCSVTEMVFERSAPPFEGRLLAWSKAEHLYGAAAELVPGIPERAAARSWETLTEVAGRDGAGRAGR